MSSLGGKFGTSETRSTCPYCGTGCGVIIESVDNTITGVRGDPQHPANFGRLCSKGSALHLTTHPAGRALYPMLRQDKGAERHRISWASALNTAANRFAKIIEEHGPDAVGFYISGQLLTEDYYAFNKLARALIGTNNIDSNSRLCMSSAVAAYKATLGADAVPCCYEDFDLCDLMLFAGSNAAWAHPVLFRRIETAKAKNPELKIIAVDPRKTDTTALADLHLQIRPGTDVVLYSAMLHVLLWEGLTDGIFIAEHTSGFEAVRDAVREITPAIAANVCGVSETDIVQAARWFGHAAAPLSLWCQGLNQSSHGTANGASLIHLHLATGKIGKPGMGPFSLTGQPNAMGGREVGAMANLLSAHRDLNNPEHRAEMALFWDVPNIPDKPGLTATELFEAVEKGQIKALWIACTNPAHSLPDQARVQAALQSCEFVMLQEAFANTETAPFADLLLPAATWGEKEGTVTNSERRISHLNAAISAPGEARSDWQIVCDFAHTLAEKMGRQSDGQRLFPYQSAQDIFTEHSASTRGRDMDITGLSYDLLDFHGPQQWPYPMGQQHGQTRLYQDHIFAFPDGRARFYAKAYPLTPPTASKIDARHPLSLNTGRLRDQWHGMSRTGRSGRLTAHANRPCLFLNPSDMARRGFVDGQLVKVSNSQGHSLWEIASDDSLQAGGAYLPMHWGGNTLGSAGANQWMPVAVDPVSKQPELKHAAIRVDPLPADQALYRLVVVRAAEDSNTVQAWREKLVNYLSAIPQQPDWKNLSVLGQTVPAINLELVWCHPPEQLAAMLQVILQDLSTLLDMADDSVQVYAQASRQIFKRAKLSAHSSANSESSLTGFLLAGETQAADWMRQALLNANAAEPFKSFIFAPLKAPPSGIAQADKTLCSCLNVGEQTIRQAIQAGHNLLGLQNTLKCGTACGSCVPEIKRLLAENKT